ncbi:MAG: thiamine pyrophosphate-requiring protein, partial [Oscillospiraceae bacterium]|nr:thiamine pyrophosphate-requiring protein [Oscillospiraceae bacterium]
QFIQNAADQAGIVRGYTKLNYEYRSGQNIQQMTYRALQIAESEPGGPVYMTATREVLEEAGVDINADLRLWGKVSPLALDDDAVKRLTDALTRAKKPLIIASYLGRNTESVGELVKLAEKLAIPVVEVNEQAYMNFPGDNPLHLGFDSHDLIADTDLVLVIDCDLPWIPSRAVPTEDCRVFYLDADPLKADIPLWYIKAERLMRADSYTALWQINAALASAVTDAAIIETRRATIHNMHKQQRERWLAEASAAENHITPEFLTMCVREIIDDDTVILNETITNRVPTDRLLPRNKPGTLFSNGASSLGWHGGAAVGMKLACPDKDIVALCGDGTYIFSCPTAVHWMAAKYNTPFMTVIYNNQGWNAPKQITTRQHPDGYAVRDNNFWTRLNPPARLDLVAEAAGGAFARTVEDPKALRQALAEGREAVRQGRAAVINVILPGV